MQSRQRLLLLVLFTALLLSAQLLHTRADDDDDDRKKGGGDDDDDERDGDKAPSGASGPRPSGGSVIVEEKKPSGASGPSAPSGASGPSGPSGPTVVIVEEAPQPVPAPPATVDPPTPSPSPPNTVVVVTPPPTTGESNQPVAVVTPPSSAPVSSAANTNTFVTDASAPAQQCNQQISAWQSCFMGVAVDFRQRCSPACYWGGLCNNGRCVKQNNDCIVFCPDDFQCSYGYCVKKTLVPQFLMALTPHLYTTNALIQPSNPAAQPLFEVDGRAVSDDVRGNGGVGGTLFSDDEELEYSAAAASQVQWITTALSTFAVLIAAARGP